MFDFCRSMCSHFFLNVSNVSTRGGQANPTLLLKMEVVKKKKCFKINLCSSMQCIMLYRNMWDWLHGGCERLRRSSVGKTCSGGRDAEIECEGAEKPHNSLDLAVVRRREIRKGWIKVAPLLWESIGQLAVSSLPGLPISGVHSELKLVFFKGLEGNFLSPVTGLELHVFLPFG